MKWKKLAYPKMKFSCKVTYFLHNKLVLKKLLHSQYVILRPSGHCQALTDGGTFLLLLAGDSEGAACDFVVCRTTSLAGLARVLRRSDGVGRLSFSSSDDEDGVRCCRVTGAAAGLDLLLAGPGLKQTGICMDSV